MAVLVTGANGFIGKYIVDELSNQNYDVIGVVRSQAKADALAKQFGQNPHLIVEVVHDITALDAFDSIFHRYGKDIGSVVHCASPLPAQGNDYENTHLIPAVNGTISLLEAIKRYVPQTVKHVVLTSSVVAAMKPEKHVGSDYAVDENNWCPLKKEDIKGNFLAAYMVSKTYAEWAAWEFLRENKGSIRFQLTTLLPAYVFGPQLFEEDAVGKLNYSNGVIEALIHSAPGKELEPDMKARFADVRDVAKAHVLALQREAAAGQRLVIAAGRYSSQDIVDILNEQFPQLKGKIAQGPHPGKFDEKSAAREHFKAEELLGIEYKGLEESIHDTAAQVLKVERRF